jgi:outer membrane autotransporter protein
MGTLVLTGANNYGNTAVLGGTLIGDVQSISGDVDNRGALVFNQSANGVYSGVISGAGSIAKSGAGILELTGNSGAFAGMTTVETGGLIVNGTLGGATTIEAGASLQGTGTLGTITVERSGLISPGNSIGTLTATGNVAFEPGSTYRVEIDGTGRHDRINVAGRADLSGGTVAIIAAPGTYRAGTTFEILNAAAGVAGKFQKLTQEGHSLPRFLMFDLGYEAGSAYIAVTPNAAALLQVAATKNEAHVARAITALPGNNAVLGAITQLNSDAEVRQAYNEVSGEVHGSVATAAFTSASLVQGAIQNRLRNGYGMERSSGQTALSAAYAAERAGATLQPADILYPDLDPRRFTVWGEGFGSWGQVRSDGNAAALDISTGGFILGAESNLDPSYRFGLAAGFARTSFDVDARLSSGTTDSTFAALYGSATWGPVNLRGGTSFAFHDIDTTRTVLFPGFTDQASASYNGSTVQAFAELGYRFAWGAAQLEPFLGASALRLHTEGFVESAGPSALVGAARNYDLGTTTVGVRAEVRVSEELPLTIRGLLGWRHAYGDVAPDALLAFQDGASPFSITGTPVDRDALVTEAGLEWQVTRDISLGASYTGQIGDRAQDHAAKGHFTLRY